MRIFGSLIFASLLFASPLRAQLNGTYTVTEDWSVTFQNFNTPPVTYQGRATGTLVISGGQYSLIDSTGIPGGDTNNTVIHVISGGPPYSSIGEYPYAGTELSSNGLVDVMHLSFFSIGIPSATFIYGSIETSGSSVYTTSGQALSGLLGSGRENIEDYYYFTASSTSSLDAQAPPPPQAPFFDGQISLGSDWYYLAATTNNVFGYYNMTYFPYINHDGLGWEYFIESGDGAHGGYFYDFTDSAWFYTNPTVFPNIYDFKLNTWLYYYLGSSPRSFYDYSTSQTVNHL